MAGNPYYITKPWKRLVKVAYEQLKSLISNIRNAKIRQKDITKLYQLIIYAVTATAFLVAIEYFTAKPELDVAIRTLNSGYYLDSIREFYKNNNLKIPQYFLSTKQFRKIFIDNDNQFEGKGFHFDVSDIELITNPPDSDNLDGIFEVQVAKLEEQLNRYRYKRRLWIFGDRGSFFPVEKFNRIVVDTKTRIQIKEYYIFLSAVIQSREITHTINLDNRGNVDLADLQLVVYPPLSKIYESRNGNILDYEFTGSILHQIGMENDNLVVSIPKLKTDQHFSLRVITKENTLEQNEISYSFKAQNIRGKEKILKTASYFFVVILFFSLYFSGKEIKK